MPESIALDILITKDYLTSFDSCHTEVEVFLDKRVRETRQTVGAYSHHGATKKREISRTLYP